MRNTFRPLIQGRLKGVLMELNLDSIVGRVRRTGVHAYVAQTGGGVATIYAGPLRVEGELEYYAVAAGPGWFEGPGWENGPR
jgi:hypothetical protein